MYAYVYFYMCMCVCTCSTSCFVHGVYLAVVHRRVEEVGEEEWGKDWGRGVGGVMM